MPMTLAQLQAYNDAWLKAWTDKDVDRLCAFYTEDCDYKDPQTAGGLKGQTALRTYLTGLFAATPPMTYVPGEVWPTEGGFHGRWHCQIGEGGSLGKLRGFDYVVLDGDKISLNEVYVHQLPAE